MKKTFTRENLISMRPTSCPSSEHNYLLPEEAPYLNSLIAEAKEKGYKKEEIASLWDVLLYDKYNNILPESAELDLAGALMVLFELLDYHDVKRHYVAFIDAKEQ